jgi:flagellar hook protein FlgE
MSTDTLGAIYTSLSGMTAYTDGLDLISNNVANMNTPGFKLSDPMFRDLVTQAGGSIDQGSESLQQNGAGVTFQQSTISLQQGQLQTTGNSLDAAINGSGFFVVDNNGQREYTRAGQFQFDADGNLVESDTLAKVVVSTDSTATGYFNLNDYRVYPPSATTTVNLSGALMRATGGTAATTYSLPQIQINDTSGASLSLTATLTPDPADPLHWSVNILDVNNVSQGTGDIRFNTDGTPATGSSSFKATITPATGPAFDVTFDFGAAGSFAGVTSVAGTTASGLQVLKQDGVALGTLTTTAFDDHGQITLTYSNGKTKTPAKLVLAQFDSPNQLVALGGSHFVAAGNQTPTLGPALSSGAGSIVGGQIEMSNVDLTNQFTELIVEQRGFQGCSQIASVANEMLQQLITMGNTK